MAAQGWTRTLQHFVRHTLHAGVCRLDASLATTPLEFRPLSMRGNSHRLRRSLARRRDALPLLSSYRGRVSDRVHAALSTAATPLTIGREGVLAKFRHTK